MRRLGVIQTEPELPLSEGWKAYLRAFDALLRHRDSHEIPVKLIAQMQAARPSMPVGLRQNTIIRRLPRELLWNCEHYEGVAPRV